MFKWLNLSSIFKFDQLLDFDQCNIVLKNVSTWDDWWLLNVKSCSSMLALLLTMHNKRHLNHYTKFTSLVSIFCLKTYLCNWVLSNQVCTSEKLKGKLAESYNKRKQTTYIAKIIALVFINQEKRTVRKGIGSQFSIVYETYNITWQ